MPETAFPPPPDKGYTRCANSHLVIEDDEPADSILSKKLQRLLTSALYASFQPKAEDTGELIPFLATANIGLFSALKLPPLMPDVTLSLEVAPPASFERKEDRTYLVWEMGKPPDVVIEIVSKRKGEELGRKRKDYARAGVSYYAVYDRTAGVASPLRQPRELQGSPLALFQRRGGEFVPFASTWLEDKGLRPANAKGLRPANAKGLRPANAKGLRPANAKGLRPANAKGLRPANAKGLRPANAKGLRPANAKGLRPANAKGLRPANAKGLRPANAKGLRPANAKGLRPANAKGLRPANAKGLRPANAKGLRPANAKGLRPANAKGLRPANAKGLRPANAKGLRPANAKGLRPANAKGLRPANAKGLRPANAKGLRPANAIAPPAA